MKKLILLVIGMIMTLNASAQFEEGKYYCGASLTGLDLNYSGNDKLKLGVAAKAGYLVADNWMLLAMASFNHSGNDDVKDYLSAGVGGRYYIIQNGLFMGVNAQLVHSKSYNDFMPGIELGYAFFVGRTVTIEPSVYYDQSIKSHSDYSRVGLRLGIGIYL